MRSGTHCILCDATVKSESFAENYKLNIDNLEIFAYVNSKFVYVEKHIKTQIRNLYRDVLLQRCNLERETSKNALAVAGQTTDEFAHNLMKGPGYMAVTACTYFLTSRTHIIKARETRVTCNTILPYYLIEGNWYKLLPKPTEGLGPTRKKKYSCDSKVILCDS